MSEFNDGFDDGQDNDSKALNEAKANKANKVYWDLINELPNDMQVKITHMITQEDLNYFQGPLGVMMMAAIHANKSKKDVERLNENLVHLENELKETRAVVETMQGQVETALTAVLSSFGRGVKEIMPKALGSVLVPAVVDQVNKRIDESVKESLNWANTQMMLTIGMSMFIGMAIGMFIMFLKH